MAAYAATSVPVRAAAFGDAARGRASSANTKSASLIKSRKAVRQIGRVSTRCVSRAALVSRGDRSFGDAHDRPARRRVPRRVLVPRRRRRDGVQNVRREPSIRARSSHPRARPSHLTLVRLTSPPRPRVHSRSLRRDVRVDVIDPLSIVVGGAVVTAGRGLLERSSSADEQATPVVPRNALPDSVVSDEGLVRADTVGTLPAIQHSYAGVFDAAGTGALSGVVTDKLAGGWWDGVANAKDERPVLELQAIHDEARKRLTSIVLETFESAFKTYAPAPGDEAEAAQDLLAAVAETSTKEWLLGSRAAAAEATSAADGSAFEEESEDGAVDEIMMRRAGDLAAGLIVVDQVESPGSKSALYVNLLSHMASLSEAAKAPSEDGEMAEAAIELAAAAKQREDEGLNFSMAAVSVTVLEDAALRVSEAVASAYLSRVREGASAPGVGKQRAARKFASKRAMVAAMEADAKKTALLAASSASKVVRYALQVQPRLKSTRALEKFRNEVKLRAWLENNYRDVVAMYEDWHALMGLDANGDIVTRRISICRHTELAQVRGLKMIVSMFLEFADVVVPVAQSALNNAKQFSSWLLVTLIGRSLGLVYRGIKESMNGGNGNANNAGNNAPRFA